MEWWIGWVIAALLGLPAAVYYSLRLTSKWGENREKRRNAEAEVRKALADAINNANDYNSVDKGQFQQLIDDARISRKLRRNLYELKSLAEQYQIWRDESWETVYNKVTVERMIFKDVDESLKQVSESFSGVFDRERTPDIYKAIYQGSLTPEVVKELLLRYRRDSKVRLTDGASGEQKELRFRDVVEGEQFHSFINMLMQLQDREFINMLRDLQRRFLDKAEAIMREIS